MKALMLLLGLALVAPGCGDDKSDQPLPQRAERSKPQVAPKKAKRIPKSLANLDAFGNLIAGKERVYGFELPMGVRDKKHSSVSTSFYIPTTDARLQRFYRSRGYLVEEGPRGYSARHTARTLSKIRPEYHPQAKRAELWVEQGPGPGYTIRVQSNAPVALAQPPLARLVGPAEEAPEVEVAEAPAAGDAVEDDPKGDAPPRRKVSTAKLAPFERQKLKKQVLSERKLPPELRDVSSRIVEWSDKTGRPFLD